jgi:RNA polymerase sigma factor (sigma-70 family)
MQFGPSRLCSRGFPAAVTYRRVWDLFPSRPKKRPTRRLRFGLAAINMSGSNVYLFVSPSFSGSAAVDPNAVAERLSRIETCWSVIRQAHGGSTEQREQARAWLVERYEGVVRRYLTKAVGAEAATELVQEFAERVLEGRYRNADPARGRFRHYLKTCLFRLVSDYRQRQTRTGMARLPDQGWEPADYRTAPESAEEQEWCQSWRQALVERSLDALRRGKDHVVYLLLRFRMDQPDCSAQQAAEVLSAKIGKEVTAGWVRKKLMTARKRFAELLLEEVAKSVDPPTLDRVTDELADLNLLHYCAPIMKPPQAGT